MLRIFVGSVSMVMIQFPMAPAFKITTTKSLAQTFTCAGIYLELPVFFHGE
jgi:hypothetical protein